MGILDEEGPVRKFLKNRPRLLGGMPKLLASSNPVIDRRFEDIRAKKKKEWTAAGFPEKLQTRALEWATEYTSGMAMTIAPRDPDLRKRIEDTLYPQSLDLAERWIKGLMKAMLP